MRTRICLAAALFALGAAGCDGGDTGGTGTTTAPSQEGCAGDPRVTEYQAGMEAKSEDGSITVSLLDADPAPPAKGDNVWTLKIVDAAGAPVTGATLALQAYMPDHAHSSTVVPEITPAGDGTYTLDPVNLFMPGVWEITVDVSPPGGTVQSVLFTLCILG